MRKILPAVAATCAVLALGPASALAHGHRGHRGLRHARHLRLFGDRGLVQSPSQSSSPGQTQGSTSAGTVQSYTGGVLTIALNGGSTVSGQVTGATRVMCMTAQPAGQQSSGEQSSGQQSSVWQGRDSNWSGNDGTASGGGDQSQGQGDDDQGQGDDGNAAQSCSATSLTPGAVVQAAELLVSGNGAVWNTVVLAPSSSSTSTQATSSSSSS